MTLSYTAPVDRDELRAAEAHIARLEGELLRLKDVKRELQSLREEHQKLRRGVEGRFVQILSAPFRLLRPRKETKAEAPDEVRSMVRAPPPFRGRNRKTTRAIAKIFVSPVGFDSGAHVQSE